MEATLYLSALGAASFSRLSPCEGLSSLLTFWPICEELVDGTNWPKFVRLPFCSESDSLGDPIGPPKDIIATGDGCQTRYDACVRKSFVLAQILAQRSVCHCRPSLQALRSARLTLARSGADERIRIAPLYYSLIMAVAKSQVTPSALIRISTFYSLRGFFEHLDIERLEARIAQQFISSATMAATSSTPSRR
jgi:hypothetical protein